MNNATPGDLSFSVWARWARFASSRWVTWWRELTLPRLWILVALSYIGIFAEFAVIDPNSLWVNMRVGQWVVEHRQVPAVDLFSFTASGQPWAYQSWLADVAAYLLYQRGGPPLIIFAHAAVLAATYGILLQVNLYSCGDARFAALATICAAAAGAGRWAVEPESLSYLFFALELLVLTWQEIVPVRGGSRRRMLLLIPLLFAVWANTHDGFLYGLGLLGASLASQMLAWVRRRRRFPTLLVTATLLSVAATLFTPSGAAALRYAWEGLRNPVLLSLNSAYMPPSINSLSGQLFFAFVLVWLVVVLSGRYRPMGEESFRLILFGVLSLVAARNVTWFAMVAAPTMAVGLRRWGESRGYFGNAQPGALAVNRALALLLGFLLVVSLPWLRPHLPLPAERRNLVSPNTPTEAVAFLRHTQAARAGEPLRVFHDEGYGSYMIWASPDIPVFIDQRMSLYPQHQWTDFLAVCYARHDWDRILARYRVDTLFLSRTAYGKLIEAVSASGNWQLAYQDERAVVYRRTAPLPASGT